MKHTAFILFSLFSTFVSAQKTGAKDVDEATVPMYIIIAGASVDFGALERSAMDISKKMGLKYENWLVYDKKRGMIVPDTSSDEIYAGSYYPRRYEENRVSIEMMWYYATEKISAADSSKMIIVAGIFGEKKNAESQLRLIKKTVPTAYIKKKEIYMGCMH